MKTYEYKMLEDCDTKQYTLEDINELGKEGWRIINVALTDRGGERIYLERATMPGISVEQF